MAETLEEVILPVFKAGESNSKENFYPFQSLLKIGDFSK